MDAQKTVHRMKVAKGVPCLPKTSKDPERRSSGNGAVMGLGRIYFEA